MASNTTPPHLNIRIVSSKGLIFQGEALSLSSTNTIGKFDILPGHANFITLVQSAPIIIRKLSKLQLKFTFPLAIIYHTENFVNIYTDLHLETNS